ncbi:MAG: tRNA lysidine(34) synthetase TilS [Zetaproteobacteria bacterium]|nr:MAG: tRNA lysidine(34) synthetase TilS [Zetaproteobacteria bacterium]
MLRRVTNSRFMCKPARQAGDRLARLLPADIDPAMGRVAVAWSGGADSTSLLLALHAGGWDVAAWHVDHGWHEGSASQACLLRMWARQLGVPFFCQRLDTSPTSNREAHARIARWRCFEGWAVSQGIRHLFLGHQADEQAETVCLRLLQGAGVRGCRGMLRKRRMGRLIVYRPWLGVRKAVLVGILADHRVPWIEDVTNEDLSLWRNRVRRRLFVGMRETGVDPIELFLRWGSVAERLFDCLHERVASVPLHRYAAGVSVAWSDWLAAAPPVRALLLQEMHRALFGPASTPGRRHIELVEHWTAQGGHGGLDLSRCRLERRKHRLHLSARVAMLR